MNNLSQAQILIVDDDIVDRMHFSEVLQDSYTVVAVESGIQALTEIESNPPNCIILDYHIPGCDTLELVEVCEERGLPVIMLTGVGNETIAVGALKRGAKDYLVKSEASQEQLHIAINAAIERDNLQKEIAQRNKDLESFAYVAGHDLRAPLHAIQLSSEVLQKGLQLHLNENEKQLFSTIDRNCKNMSQLIHDLLEYSRLGSTEVPLETIQVKELLDEILWEFSESIREAHAIIEIQALSPILGIHSSIQQLFRNLIGNALKFRSDAPPFIEIASQPYGNNLIQFSITDNGIGMKKDDLEVIFDAFHRLNEPEQYEGTGIGLAICKKVVKQHGGNIWVTSRKGLGSTFFFTLPAGFHNQIK